MKKSDKALLVILIIIGICGYLMYDAHQQQQKQEKRIDIAWLFQYPDAIDNKYWYCNHELDMMYEVTKHKRFISEDILTNSNNSIVSCTEVNKKAHDYNLEQYEKHLDNAVLIKDVNEDRKILEKVLGI